MLGVPQLAIQILTLSPDEHKAAYYYEYVNAPHLPSVFHPGVRATREGDLPPSCFIPAGV